MSVTCENMTFKCVGDSAAESDHSGPVQRVYMTAECVDMHDFQLIGPTFIAFYFIPRQIVP